MAMVPMHKLKPFRNATALRNDPPALRRTAEEEGYLYLPGLLPAADVLALRRAVLEVCARLELLDPARPLLEGIARPGVFLREDEHSEAFCAFYREILKLRAFHAFALTPAIVRVLEAVLGGDVLPHARNICRVVFPSSSRFTTAPHQDFPYIGGSERTWTCWVPLGDVPGELGGLAIAPRTHRKGILAVRPAEGANDLQVNIPEDLEWVWNPMRAGDALFLNCYVVHQGRDNQLADTLRLSVDYRYQPREEPVRADSLEPHYGGFGLGWEGIYAAWPAGADPLKYYWQQHALNVEAVPTGTEFKDRRVRVDNTSAAQLDK